MKKAIVSLSDKNYFEMTVELIIQLKDLKKVEYFNLYIRCRFIR